METFSIEHLQAQLAKVVKKLEDDAATAFYKSKADDALSFTEGFKEGYQKGFDEALRWINENEKGAREKRDMYIMGCDPIEESGISLAALYDPEVVKEILNFRAEENE